MEEILLSIKKLTKYVVVNVNIQNVKTYYLLFHFRMFPEPMSLVLWFSDS